MIKQTVIYSFIVLFLTAACQKETTAVKKDDTVPTPTDTSKPPPNLPTYYIYAKVNGSEVVLKATNFLKDNPKDVKEAYLMGFADFPNKLPSFQFTLKKPVTGFQTGMSYVLDENDRQSFVNYTNLSLNIFKSTATPAGDSSGIRLYFTSFPSDSGSIIEGRFSGTMQLEESVQTITIKDGRFKVPSLN